MLPWSITAHVVEKVVFSPEPSLNKRPVIQVSIVGHLFKVEENDAEYSGWVKDPTGTVQVSVLKNTQLIRNNLNGKKIQTLKDRIVCVIGTLHPSKKVMCEFIEARPPSYEQLHKLQCCVDW